MKSKILIGAFMVISNLCCASSPNHNVKYYGYDWIDAPAMNADDALNAISTTGFSETNLNVVHTLSALELAACSSARCALSIQAGTGGSFWADICPGATTNEECQSRGSWSNIWHIVNGIKQASSQPSAIYFIDEPFNNLALKSDGVYVKYQYSSYVCTLRQAMVAYGLDIPVFTILSYGSAHSLGYVSEIQHQMPSSGCPVAYRSMPDWVGVDNYHWTESDMWAVYNFVAPTSNWESPKWVLVPPSTSSLGMNDEQLHDQIQLYWNFLVDHPDAPVVTVMNWRFDRNVTMNRGVYPLATALLSFMGNSLTP